MKQRTYKITVADVTYQWTLQELRWYLTREAYEMYFKIHFQHGTIQFGIGALCTPEFMAEFKEASF